MRDVTLWRAVFGVEKTVIEWIEFDQDAELLVAHVTVVGQDNTNSTGADNTQGGGTGSNTTSGANGIGSGNQTGVGVGVPVNTSGNQVTVVGQDNNNSTRTGNTQGNTTSGSSPSSPEVLGVSAGAPGRPSSSAVGNGIISENQAGVVVAAPGNVPGNLVTVFGQDNVISGDVASNQGSSMNPSLAEVFGVSAGAPGQPSPSAVLSGSIAPAGVLPQTGAMDGLLLMILGGLSMLMIGLGLRRLGRRQIVA